MLNETIENVGFINIDMFYDVYSTLVLPMYQKSLEELKEKIIDGVFPDLNGEVCDYYISPSETRAKTTAYFFSFELLVDEQTGQKSIQYIGFKEKVYYKD